MEYQWIVEENWDLDGIAQIKKELGVPEIIAKILWRRGIDTFEKAKKFFRPDISELYSPFLMKDMRNATVRLIQALKKGEHILVYGDYDVDGTTSVALLYMVLRKFAGYRVSFFIPDRISEGYGLSKSGIQRAKEDGINLIITVDCGITAVEEVAYAKELGIDVIISDHHVPAEILPDALAILDPKMEDEEYPFKELAGVGVAYKLLQALFEELKLDQNDLAEYLDLVAVGSCADIVPLIDENRILVKNGLDIINQNPRVGIRALLESAGIARRHIQASSIVFNMAPRINAVGRMGDAGRAVNLFVTEDIENARSLARELEDENRTRRGIDEVTFKDAVSLIEKYPEKFDSKAFVVYKTDWHPGVIGIVASRLVEKFYKPTIMIAVTDGVGKGSARSVDNFNIFDAIKKCEGHLIEFGGHKNAAGLSIKEENIPPFIKDFTEVVDRQMKEETCQPKINISTEVILDEFTDQVYRILKLLGPFGPLNLRPVFLSKKCQVVEGPAIIGKNHLKMKIKQGESVYETIGFNMGDKMNEIKGTGSYVDLVYQLDENYWNGKTTIQLRLKDIRHHSA
ncbi:MAG: single-stranded-DNA-specific exonuclease RecJ [Calditrichia bacterium]|nr:single-stranded-DNA-specific exonuclease RecJ [Calditrichia bacterium]